MPRVRDSRVTRGSGNVFDDLGFPNAEDHLAKAELVSELKQIIDREEWTQAQAAKVMGMAQPDVSRSFLRGQFSNYSIDRIMRFLRAAGCEVEITVRAKGMKSSGADHSLCALQPGLPGPQCCPSRRALRRPCRSGRRYANQYIRRHLRDRPDLMRKLYEGLWPLETDLLQLLPKPDGVARAIYTGIIHPNAITRFAKAARSRRLRR